MATTPTTQDIELPPYPDVSPPLYPPTILTGHGFVNQAERTHWEIRALSSLILKTTTLHLQVLEPPSPHHPQTYTCHALFYQSNEANTLIQTIHDQLRALRADAQETPDSEAFEVKKGLVEALVASFREEIMGYYRVNDTYQLALRKQIVKQYLILNPAATDDDAQGAADRDWSGDEVFRDLHGSRTPQSAAVLANVAVRCDELQRVDCSVNELSEILYELERFTVQHNTAVVVTNGVSTARANNENADLEARRIAAVGERSRRKELLVFVSIFSTIGSVALFYKIVLEK